MKCLFWGSCVALSCLNAGCSSSENSEQNPASSADVVTVGNGSPIEHPYVSVPSTSRSTLRLTVAMLRNSLPVIAGNDLSGNPITWRITLENGREVDALSDDALAFTLGKPDYVSVTSEASDPSSLYVKFMDDMARDVCPRILTADYEREAASSRTLLRFVEPDTTTDTASIFENLKYLKLRFHGEKVTDDADVQDLKAVFDSAVAEEGSSDTSKKARAGWNAVCIGLFLSPHFHIY